MQKTVYTYHPVTLGYTGPLELSADRGDMDPMEPGRWLVPGGCLEIAPPEVPAGQYAAAEAGSWVLRDIPLEPEAPQPEPLTDEQRIGEIDRVIEGHLDGVARANGFRDMDRAVSYRGDPDPVTGPLAEALFLWRSACWAAARVYRGRIVAGEADIPTSEEAIAMLPALELPE